MASLLDKIPKQIFAGFKGKLLAGVLRRPAPGPLLDDYGDPTTTVVTTYNCQGFVDNFSVFYLAQAGIPLTDIKWNIFAASLTGSLVPQKDDQVQFREQWYQIRTVNTDPAQALWFGAAFAIEAP